ncbi:hypothetical protein EP7_005370 [Isosphaeraceae bacterium EP7]
MLFIMTQQVQPDFIMEVMQSQQAWIMAQQAASPLVQVMQTPMSQGSHLVMPIIMLQLQAIMPFIMQQQDIMLPAIMVQRFCSMAADISSSHLQVTFMPPVHFSKVMVQRGTIIMFMPAGVVVGAVPVIMPAAGIPMPMPVMPIIVPRSIIFAVAIGLGLPGSASHLQGRRFRPFMGRILPEKGATCKELDRKYSQLIMIKLIINEKLIEIRNTPRSSPLDRPRRAEKQRPERFLGFSPCQSHQCR